MTPTVEVLEGETIHTTVSKLLNAGYPTEQAYELAEKVHNAIAMVDAAERLPPSALRASESYSQTVNRLMRPKTSGGEGMAYSAAATHATAIHTRAPGRGERFILLRGGK